ncbi:hypothetical protein N9D23_15100 [Rubripirellula sp.]|nr:hypothetical protein [Rubripirellula sp.]
MTNEPPNPFSQPIESSTPEDNHALNALGIESKDHPTTLAYDDSWKINRALGCLILALLGIPAVLFLVVLAFLRFTFW